MTTQSTTVLEKARTRSVDNLQRLYTVVVSLAVTEQLKRLLTPFTSGVQQADYNAWLMCAALIVTVVPFYHGANRYLDATYVTGEREARPAALMFDFIMLFIEGLLLFALAMLTGRVEWFYTILAAVFLFDAAWVGSTYLTNTGEASRAPFVGWAIVNVIAAAAMLMFVWLEGPNWFHFKSALARDISLVGIAVGRTIYDYISVWRFYYPKGENRASGNIPAPRPAPPPLAS